MYVIYIFSHITENYLTDDNRPAPSYEKLKAFVDSKIPPDAVFDIPPIEHDFVLKELQNLDPKKAVGTDGLSLKMLWMIAPAIVTAIVKVINLSIGSSWFPTLRKMARVCPIFKNGRSDEKSNYRPISILWVLSKILEKTCTQSFRQLSNEI